ncbi:MAG TPA: hypothetical protein VIF11_15490 [Methylomirabilota bacterium]
MSARRIILLLTAWLSFDLATPLPGAFEFEIKDSEIEHSMQVDRQAQARRTAASRSTVRERVEPGRPVKVTTPAPAIVSATGDRWVRQIRLAHRPSASRASSLEDH